MGKTEYFELNLNSVMSPLIVEDYTSIKKVWESIGKRDFITFTFNRTNDTNFNPEEIKIKLDVTGILRCVELTINSEKGEDFSIEEWNKNTRLGISCKSDKKIPREWINEAGNGLKQEFIDYALPLIQGESTPPKEDGLPRFARLKKVLATK